LQVGEIAQKEKRCEGREREGLSFDRVQQPTEEKNLWSQHKLGTFQKKKK